jgi:capsular polysaccharide biosynthesis protein
MTIRSRLRPYYHSLVRKPLIRFASATLRRFPVSSEVVGPPKGTVPDIDRWALNAQGGSGPQARYFPIAPADRLYLKPPITRGDDSFYELYCAGTTQRSLKTDSDGRLYCERPRKFVVTIPHGRVVGCDGAIITPDDAIVPELSPEFESERYIKGRHSLLSQVRLPKARHIEGTVAVLATLGQFYFGHWMMDMLPRIRLLEAAGIDRGDIDVFYLAEPALPFQQESLAASSLPAERIIDCRANPHVRADRLIVPSPLSEVFQASRYSCDYLNNLFGPKPGATVQRDLPRRLYISRRSTNHRRIVNDADVLARLEPLGFVALEPQFRRLREVARLFANAEVIVAPLGSAVANFVYCRPGTVIIEIQNRRAVQTSALAICSERNLEYAYMLGTGVSPESPGLQEDMTVDIEELLELVGMMIQPSLR